MFAAIVLRGVVFGADNSEACGYKQVRQRWHMPTPAGWVLNEEASELYDANIYLSPGKNLKTLDRQLVIKAHPKSDPYLGPTLDHSIKRGIQHYRSLYGGGTYTDAPSIPTGAGVSARLYSFKPGKVQDIRPSYESWVFLEEQQCFIDLYVGAYSQEVHDANLPAFKWLVSNFKKKVK
jgi:hypothetical protein